MTQTEIDNILQWAGTVFVLAMYTVMNFFPELAPWNILFGLLGAVCYFAWTVRVRNWPQMLINVVAITLCTGGLIRHFG